MAVTVAVAVAVAVVVDSLCIYCMVNYVCMYETLQHLVDPFFLLSPFCTVE